METQNGTRSDQIDKQSLKRIVLIRSVIIFSILGLALFLPAWSLQYWEGWAYLVVLGVPMMIFGMYLFKHDPALLERRMRTKETRKEQKLVIKISVMMFPFLYILPGFDKRFGWSEVPVMVEVVALVFVLTGYLMTVSVLKTNSYASRVVEVEKSQKVISTGPYSLVRHPMYASMMILYLSTPFALGSYWAVIPAVVFLLSLMIRIRGEEEELEKNLEGYREYKQTVKYRLIPGLW